MYASGPCWNGDDPAAILPLFGAGDEVMIVEIDVRSASKGIGPGRLFAACARFSWSGDQELPWLGERLHRDSVGRTKPRQQARHALAAIEGVERSAAVPTRHVTSRPVLA